MQRKKSEYSVQSIENAFDILEYLGEADSELSILEISRRLNLTKSNALKLLATLEHFGYVDLNKYTGNYKLGVKTFQISQSYLSKLSLIDSGFRIMAQLRDKVNESVYISVVRDFKIVFLNAVETHRSVRIRSRIGNVAPAFASAEGKVQLAFLENLSIDKFLEKSFAKVTSKTIDNYEVLKKEIENIRKKGFAIDIEEYEDGVVCVAAPVFNFMKKVIAAISVPAPLLRVSEEKLVKEITPLVKNAASQLSLKFGYKDV